MVNERLAQVSEVDDDHEEQPQAANHRVLSDHGVEVDSLRPLAVLDRVHLQRQRQVQHFVERVAPVQQVLNVLRHHLLDVGQVVVQPVQVQLDSLVLVYLLRFQQKVVKQRETEGTSAHTKRILAVTLLELVADLVKIGERQLARIPFVTDTQVDDLIGNNVVDIVGAQLNRRLRSRVRGDSQNEDLALLLLFIEARIRLVINRPTQGKR